MNMDRKEMTTGTKVFRSFKFNSQVQHLPRMFLSRVLPAVGKAGRYFGSYRSDSIFLGRHNLHFLSMGLSSKMDHFGRRKTTFLSSSFSSTPSGPWLWSLTFELMPQLLARP